MKNPTFSKNKNPQKQEEQMNNHKDKCLLQPKYSKIKSQYQKYHAHRQKDSQYDIFNYIENLKNKVESQPNLSKNLSFSAQKKQQHKNIRFGREEKQILYLHPSLQKLKKQKKLDQKNVQIKYVNTLKKIKQKSMYLGCKVKVQGKGFTLQNTKEKQLQQEQTSRYKFGKQFNRNLRRKIIQRLQNCSKNNQSLHNIMEYGVVEMKDTIQLNENKSSIYQDFTSKRMETYLKSLSTQKKQMPYFAKKGIEKTFQKIKLAQQLPTHPSRKTSNIDSDKYHQEFQLTGFLDSPINKGSKSSKNTTSQKWTQLITDLKDDIQQFSQICDFFEKIQHELLRYMPNNHLSNKINMVISQVQHGRAIRKIYDYCNDDITILTPQKIVKFLKQEEGILSSMNYIVNIIKLNISAERKKRFWDVQKIISKYQQLTIKTANKISARLKTIDNGQIKKNINDTVKKTNINCRGLDPIYLQYVKQAEQQQFSTINSIKNRTTICEILKYEALIK